MSETSSSDMSDITLNNQQGESESKIKRFEPRVLSIKIDEEFIENNMIDLPFVYYYKTKTPPTSIEYEWISSDNQKKKIEVRSTELGVPTSYDNDVLLALSRIYIKQQGDKIICDGDIDFSNIDTKVKFSYRELIHEMGYKDISQDLITKVDKSIERLCDTNIYNTGGGIYNSITKEYITDFKFQVGILHHYQSYRYITVKGDDGEEKRVVDKKALKDKCSVEIDTFFLKGLLTGKGKISDKNLRLSLKIDIARRLYLILNKWRNKRHETFYKFETLYDRIPLKRRKEDNDYYRKRRLKDACEELVAVGYISYYEFTKEGVLFRFGDAKVLKLSDNPLLNKYNDYESIMSKLKEYGMTDYVLDTYFQIHNIPYYQALLRFIDDRKDTIENISNYLFRGMVEQYKNIDERYYNK